MATSNINKIVQSNFNLKPWVLSKNTSEIVNTCIQKIYKQLPNNFRKGLKTSKVATPRPENQGPIRTYKNEERLRPVRLSIAAQYLPTKKSLKSESTLVKNIKARSGNSMDISNKIAGVHLTTSRKLLKSPNYKIYKSRRFGSSANSSRSSIMRRNDERRRQRLHYHPQVNYLAHSFNNNQLEGTYARYLMPLRNQQVQTHLGSLAHAKRISEDIQNDLMKIDTVTLGRISIFNSNNTTATETKDRLNVWNHPPSLDLYSKPETTNYAAKNNCMVNRKLTRLSPENRESVRISAIRQTLLKQNQPPNEQLATKFHQNKTELRETHRRNRMKKLGLMNASPLQSDAEEDKSTATVEDQKLLDQNNVRCEFKTKWTPNIASHMEAKAMVENNNPIRVYNSKFQSRLSAHTDTQVMRHSEDKQPGSSPQKSVPTEDHTIARLAKNEAPTKSSTPLSDEVNYERSNLSICYTSTGPAAAARAQLTNNTNNSNHRYNRDDFFSPKKY